MAFITVGIDTSRVYNKKQPPGGQCAELFGGHPDIATGGGGDGDGDTKNRRLNRLMSNVELGTEKEGKVVEQPRVQRKSQPSVCPVTGETIGHNMPAIEPVNKTETKAEIVKKEEKHATKKESAVEAVKTDEKAKPESKAEPTPDVTTAHTAIVAHEPVVPEISTEKEQSAIPVSAKVKSSPQEHKIADTQPTPEIMPTPLSPPSTPTLMAAQTPDSKPVMTSSAPAPVKTRRVPPGGHTTALW